MDIVVISPCLKVASEGELELAYFHFQGFFYGEPVQSIIGEYRVPPYRPEVGRDYLLQLKFKGINSGILRGKLKSLEALDEMERIF